MEPAIPIAIAIPNIPEIMVGPLKTILVERPSDPEERRDRVRAFTTGAFIIIFGLTVLLSFVIVIFYSSAWANAKELIQFMLPAETALIGSAVGFYFGSKSTLPEER